MVTCHVQQGIFEPLPLSRVRTWGSRPSPHGLLERSVVGWRLRARTCSSVPSRSKRERNVFFMSLIRVSAEAACRASSSCSADGGSAQAAAILERNLGWRGSGRDARRRVPRAAEDCWSSALSAFRSTSDDAGRDGFLGAEVLFF